MAVLAPMLIGSLSATAAVGSATALSLGSILSIGSAAAGAVSAFGQSRYQAQVASNNAQIAEDNAQRAIFDSQNVAQEQDVQARDELGAILANAGASGLNAATGSLAANRRSKQQLAAKDRGLTRSRGDQSAAQSRQQASDLRTQSNMQKRKGFFSLVGGALDIGSSSLTSAAQVNKRKANRIVR